MFWYVSTIPLTELELFIKCNDSTFGRHESEHLFLEFIHFYNFLTTSYVISSVQQEYSMQRSWHVWC